MSECERERCEGMPPPIGGLDVVRLWKKDTAHAEAVAAKLVEVICEQEVERQEWFLATAKTIMNTLAERDAARAEVAALRDQSESVRELLHRQRVLHANLIAPTHPNAPVLIQVDQVLALIEEAGR